MLQRIIDECRRIRGLLCTFIFMTLCLATASAFSQAAIEIGKSFDLRKDEHKTGVLIGHLPGNIMEVGNQFELVFDLKLKEDYWSKQSAQLHPIVTLAPSRYDFIYGGTETMQVSIGSQGLSLMTHYKGYIRRVESDFWRMLPKRKNRWVRIKVACSGFGGLILYINGKEALKLEDFGGRSWSDRLNFGSGWAFRSHGEPHNLWLSAPDIRAASCLVKDIRLKAGRPVIQVN